MNTNLNRFFALLIDLIFISIIYNFVSNFINLNVELGAIRIFGLKMLYGYSFLFVIYLIYFLAFDFFNNSITLGKIFTKLRVVSNKAGSLNYNKFIRTFLKILSLVLFPIAGIFFILKGTTIQDEILDTRTISLK